MNYCYRRLKSVVSVALGIPPYRVEAMGGCGKLALEDAVEIFCLEDCKAGGRVSYYCEREERARKAVRKEQVIIALKALQNDYNNSNDEAEKTRILEKIKIINQW